MRIKAMKSPLIAVLGLAVLLTGPALAADMTLRKAAAVVPEDPWYGLYLGVAGGWGWGHSTHDGPNGFTSGSFNQTGWIAGGVAGYNWHLGSVVVGVELDISAADIDGTSSPTGGTCGTLCETKLGWLYTGRARLGVPFGSIMPYVTGGGAVAGLRAVEAIFPTGASPHVWGWTAGGGFEFMPLPQWSFRAEYLHADFGNAVDATDGFGTGVGGNSARERNVNIVRFGLTYYLGSDRGIVSAVSTKY
jgi:outer membrane immunogenic protein